MTGWEIIKLIKEHKATTVRRSGDHKVAFMAAEFSSIIKWYPIDVSSSYGSYLTDFFEEPTKWTCQYTIENFLRELLAFDDWEEFQECDCDNCVIFINQMDYKEEE